MENYLPKTMDFYLPKSMDFSLPFTYITYTFIFGIEFGIKMTYEEYLEELEKTKADINFEELLISREVQQLTSFCKEAKTPKEMREYLNISSRVSFDKRILKPLYSAGKFRLIRGKCAYDWRYVNGNYFSINIGN